MDIPATVERLRALGWLKSGETPLAGRLTFPLTQETTCLNEHNLEVRDRVIADMLSGAARPTPLPRWISEEHDDDLLVAEVDRYGLPLRTVISRGTGLMRSDPYYDPEYIETFYRDHYRDLYRPSWLTIGGFLGDQLKAGEEMWQEVRHALPDVPEGPKVLDVGCGMGGVAAAFRLHGCRAWGCDYGREYLNYGRMLNLDLIEGDGRAAQEHAPFDLIVLSHVVEHQVDPVKFLRELRSLLAENGLLYVRVPGISTIRHYFQGNLLNYLQNAHVWHFTRSTMCALMAKSGFAVTSCTDRVHCLARRTENPVPVQIGANEGEAVIKELRLLDRFIRLPRAMQHGVKALRRVQKMAFH
ncbi:MAG: hypothetical protein ABS79_07635 [Planctomycetes bacterium SCN 63-9]|nr:MAG: hypothetical protein ABS79_07635 [Planctomycetes bacterium SCN 63-9]